MFYSCAYPELCSFVKKSVRCTFVNTIKKCSDCSQSSALPGFVGAVYYMESVTTLRKINWFICEGTKGFQVKEENFQSDEPPERSKAVSNCFVSSSNIVALPGDSRSKAFSPL